MADARTRLARGAARDIADRLKGSINGMISSTMQQAQGRRLNAAANNVIRRRAARATAAAARGSKPAARAREIYGAQLASTGGKGRKVGRNSIQPGPRNTKGKPRKARKPRKPKG